MIIKEYSQKKLTQYLEAGKRYLIVFQHGLGDTVMFYPVYESLRDLHPECQIDLHVSYGQENVFNSEPFDESKYDICFVIHFPMAEATPFTKAEYSCMWEIGMDYKNVKRETASLPDFSSPLVGVHFQGTSMDKVVSVPEGLAKIMWDEIKEAGYIPFEVFFQHCFYNPENKKYNFIDNTCRGCEATLPNLIGMLRSCGCFMGVVSGPLMVACSLYPDRVCCLQRGFKLQSFIKRQNIHTIDFMDSYKFGSVKRWLDSLPR